MDIDQVMRAQWCSPHPNDHIVSITQMREYVIIITDAGFVWRAEDDPHCDIARPLFSLIGYVA